VSRSDRKRAAAGPGTRRPAHAILPAPVRLVILLSGFGLLAAGTPAASAAPLKFWNLTSATIVELHLAPAGTQSWSANQCANDPEGAVETDERLALTGIEAGHWDVDLTDKSGRRCLVRNIELKAAGHYAFSLADTDLTECRN